MFNMLLSTAPMIPVRILRRGPGIGLLTVTFCRLNWAVHTAFSSLSTTSSSFFFFFLSFCLFRITRVFGLYPSFAILETKKHNFLETGSVSVLRWGGRPPTLLGPLERANLNHWSDPVSETLCALEVLGFWASPIVRYSRNQKTRCFRNWICFHPQVSWWWGHTYSLVSLRQS
jgi:hypothetical protein